MYECKIAEKLVELRTLKGVTQEDVAQSLSVSNKTISKWENGASTPDLSMLAELANYYEVTTDTLLGLSENNKPSTAEEIRSLFEGLDKKNAVLKAFEIERTIVPALFEIFSRPFNSFRDIPDRYAEIYDTKEAFPTNPSCFYRSNITHEDIFKFITSSEDVNLSVLLLGNKSNFAWMNDDGKQKEIVKVFRLLSNEDALSVLYFIHSKSCSVNFTADYVAKNTGVKEECVTEILNEFCNIGGCAWTIAHLIEGDVKVYECYGDGFILTLITLAYEKMCGNDYNLYSHKGNYQMIRR